VNMSDVLQFMSGSPYSSSPYPAPSLGVSILQLNLPYCTGLLQLVVESFSKPVREVGGLLNHVPINKSMFIDTMDLV